VNHGLLRSIRAFHEAVQTMSSTSLWRQDELRVGLAMSFGPGARVHTKDLPDLDRFRSLMLDFRQLISNDDAANLNRLCNCAFKARPEWADDKLTAIAAARRRFNEALDQTADMYSQPDGAAAPTVRLLLEDWISGEWFHRDEERRARRIGYEFVPKEDLSLVVIVPAVREAIAAAIELDSIVAAKEPYISYSKMRPNMASGRRRR
jgi:hypothetical protein